MILDIAIGMMFIYLLMSLLCSAGQEIVSSMFSWRANNLKEAINTMLKDPNATFFVEQFHLHPVIDKLALEGKSPSYIHASHFSATVMDILHQQTGKDPFSDVKDSVATLPDGPVKQRLSIIVARSKADTDVFISELEQWFDHGMDRASGWYKRKSQKAMFVIAFLLAVALNVDSIQLATTLWQNSTKREAIVSMAANYQMTENSTNEPIKDLLQNKAEVINKQLDSMGLPIGWETDKEKSICQNLGDSVNSLTLFGWLITACFTSLGAPFWFDMLGKTLNLRASGKKPSKV